MLVKDEPNFSIDDYMNRAFRDGTDDDGFDGLKEKMSIMNSYVCGGLDFLYERFKDLNRKDAIIDSIYELVHNAAIEANFLELEGLSDFSPIV